MANRPLKLKSGQTLDQELIDKLSSAAERGYDLSKAQRVFIREGRPARGEEGGESPRVASRIPRAIYLAAKKRAANDGMTVSEVVRALLAGYAVGKSSRVAATVRNVRAAQASDSDLTATKTYNGERRRTIDKAKKRHLYSRRTSVNVRGRKKPGL